MPTQDQIFEVDKDRMNAFHGMAETRHKGVFDLALLGLKTVTLLNGGAIVALFTLLGHIENLKVDVRHLWWAFACFCSGLIFGLFSNLLGYLAQVVILKTEWQIAEYLYRNVRGSDPGDFSKIDQKIGDRFLIGAIILVFIAVVAFVAGSWFALSSVVPSS